MMTNHDIATLREFMFCAWLQIRMEKLILQFIKKKLTSLDKFPPLNYHKTLISPSFYPPPPENVDFEQVNICWNQR